MFFYGQNVCMIFADGCYNLCLLIGYGRGYIFEPVYDFNSLLQLRILVKYFYSVIVAAMTEYVHKVITYYLESRLKMY